MMTQSDKQPTDAELQSVGLKFAQTGPIAEITLCNPKRRNAQHPAMWRALANLGETMPADVRILIVRAEGPSFSAGLDLSMMTANADAETLAGLLDGPDASVAQAIHDYQEGFLFLGNPDFISIAAVQGHAVGAGFQLALRCDIRIVADDAVFCMKETALGLVPDLTGLTPLVRQIGYGRALEICVRARNVDAHEALALGLAHSMVPAGDLERETREIARTFLQADRAAAREVKQLIQSAEFLPIEHQRQLEADAQTRLLRKFIPTTNSDDRPPF